MQDTLKKPHNLILDSRKKLSLSGVNDVSGFNEETVNSKCRAQTDGLRPADIF